MGSNWGGVADACCSTHGGMAIYEALEFIYTTDKNGVLSIKTRTNYPSDPNVTLQIDCGKISDFEVRIRTPRWLVEPPRITINGEEVKYTVRNKYAIIKGAWQPKDRIEARFSFHMALVLSGENGFADPRMVKFNGECGVFEEVALIYGHLVLMIDRELNPNLGAENSPLSFFVRRWFLLSSHLRKRHGKEEDIPNGLGNGAWWINVRFDVFPNA